MGASINRRRSRPTAPGIYSIGSGASYQQYFILWVCLCNMMSGPLRRARPQRILTIGLCGRRRELTQGRDQYIDFFAGVVQRERCAHGGLINAPRCAFLIAHLKRRRVFWFHFPPIVDPGGRNIGVS
jgi:hypothetical protein